MILLIARRELKELFATPAGWLALAGVQLLIAWLWFAQLEIYLKIQPRLTAANSPLGIFDLVISPMLSALALALLVVIPLLGMNSLSAEIRSGRIALYLSSPVHAWQLVLGKWLGLMLAVLPSILLLASMSLLLGLGSSLDSGRLAASILGLLLLTALVAALSLWLSAANTQALGAAALSWALLFLLWLLDANGAESMALLSLKAHILPFFKGWLRSQDLLYFIAFSLFALGLAIHRVWRAGGGR